MKNLSHGIKLYFNVIAIHLLHINMLRYITTTKFIH